jgi:hypothetical protein
MHTVLDLSSKYYTDVDKFGTNVGFDPTIPYTVGAICGERSL